MDEYNEVEHEGLQKKTFTKWINAQFAADNRPLVNDLFDDLRDGTKLLALLAVLTGRDLKPEIGRMRVHQLNNVNQVMQLLGYYNVKLVGISSDHIVDGNPKMTLGLVWIIIQHWQMENLLNVSDNGETVQVNLEKNLLDWCIQSTAGYRNVSITNFTSSWTDGLAFNALLHRFNPELFNYDQLIGCDSFANLRHAFCVASEKLGIPPLLDPEDVCMSNPDKKSIMMYIMCCYQVLAKEKRNTAPSSTASLHGDYQTGFQSTLESVLMWLLDAQDELTKKGPVAGEVQAVKEQFQQHEEFMVQLTVQQGRIGHVLHVGSQLLADSSTSDDTAQQIEAQMALLNNHWEELRIKAMDRQTRLQQVLMSLQQQQLDTLSEWLTMMESQLKEYSQWDMGINQQSLRLRQDKLKLLQEDMENEQEHVNRLQNMVVVVDESNTDEACLDLEKQLELLGHRWGNVCRAVEEHSADLEKTASLWKDFDSLNSEFCSWLTQSESNVDQLPLVNSSTDMSTISEQVRLLKVLECEVDEWIPRFEELQVRARQLNQVLDKTAGILIDEQMHSLRIRWEAFIQRMEQRSFEIIQSGVELNVTQADKESQTITVTRKSDKSTDIRSVTVPVLASPASKRRRIDAIHKPNPVPDGKEMQLQAEINALHSTINEYSVESIFQADDSSQHLKICTEKLNDLLMNKSRLIKLSQQIHEELGRSTDSSQLETELINLNQHWADAVQKLSDRQLQLKTRPASMAPFPTSGSAQDQVKAFTAWMDEVEKVLNNQQLIVDEQDVVEHQLAQYLILQTDVENYKQHFSNLDQLIRQYLQKPPADVNMDELCADWQKVQWRWASTIDAVNTRVSQCQSTVDQIEQYKGQVAAIKQWIHDMEEFIQPFTESFTTVETLQDQLHEVQAVKQDVKTMESSLLNVGSLADTLMEAAGSGAFHEKLRVEVEQLNVSFVEVTRAMNSQNDFLSSILDQVQNLLQEVKQLDVRIVELMTECQRIEIGAQTSADLIQLEHSLKDFVAKISQEETKVRHINDEISNLTSSTVMLNDFEDLNKPLMQLNLNWAQLQSQANDKYSKVQTLGQNYTTFAGLIPGELKWLDQLEQKLSVGPRSTGDAEELSEELDELENFIHSQKQGNQAQLNNLVQTLRTNNVMVASVNTQMTGYQQRYETLIAKAKQAMVHLEESIMQAQNRESRILDMSQWMVEMNDLLQSRLDADILAGDVPKEYETLKAEFTQQERMLQELEADSVTFHEQKKPEAAERLDQQIALLKRHFAEVSTKFAKFQRPADFDTKQIHVKRLLDDVDQRLHLIELTTSDLESVQNKLDQCMKFYRTMSEIKPDVEYVIKTGRQIVEKKQVDFPSMLTSQIDAIKQQYNHLGGLITGSKTTLEKACKLLNGLTQELANIQSFVDSLRTELVSRESSKMCANVDQELNWLEVMLMEVDKKQALATNLDDALLQFSKLSEDIIITDTEQEIRHIDEQLSELTDRLQSRHAVIEELANRWDKQYSEFDSLQSKLLLWMNNAAAMLSKISGSSPIRLQIQAERNQHISEVDHIRDLAVELMNNSGKHQNAVETQLTAFNQHWLDIDELLKDQLTVTDASPVGSKVVRATAALTQLLAESDRSSTEVLDVCPVGQLNSYQENVDTDEDVVKKLMDIKPDERNIAVDVHSQDQLQQLEQRLNSIQRQINQKSTFSQSELQQIKNELNVCQSKLQNVQSSGSKAAIVISLEKKLFEIRSSVSASSTAQYSDVCEQAIENSVELQISSPLQSSAPASDISKSNVQQATAQTSVSRLMSSPKSAPIDDVGAKVTSGTSAEAGSMPKLDSFIGKLDNFAVVLTEKAKSYPVVIGQISDIEQAAVTKRTIEKDLKLMKPQIEAIVSKCEALKSESSSEQYNQLLNENVTRLCQCWQSSIETVAERHGVLEQMLTDCRQYNVSYTEADRWILHNIEMYDTDTVGADVATIKQQIDILESERLEIIGSRHRVDTVVQQAQMLINKNKFDDPSQINSEIRYLNEHWQDLMERLSEREKSLQNAVNAMYRFDSDMKNCLLWLTKVEVVLNHHNEMSADAQRMDERQMNQIKDAVQGLQLEIGSQKSLLESLNSTARQMNRNSGSSVANVLTQLDDMNKRMAKLTSRATEISNRLKMPAKLNSVEELTAKLNSLLQWLSAKSNEINRQRPVGGDIQSVKQQLDAVQYLQNEMHARQPELDDCFSKAQTALQSDAVKDSLSPAVVSDVQRMLRDVQQTWADVKQRSDVLQNDLDETLEKLSQLQDALEDLCHHLVSLERETTKWKPVANILVEDLQNQIDSILKFQQKVAPTQSEVDHCNDLANQFTDVVLSHKNVSQLEDLNKRWMAMHQSVELRLRQLQEALYEFGPQSQQLLAASVLYPWQRAVSSNSVPYYIDHKNESTHWDHPEMNRIMQSLFDFNEVKFSAYRTAMKLHKLQKVLNFDLIDLESVDKVLAALPSGKSGSDPAVVHVPDIINSLVTLFEPLTIKAPMSRDVNIPLSIDLVLNWLLNVYDSGRSGQLRANSFKVALVLMCNAQYEDKYRLMYRVAANVGNKLDRHGLTTLLRDCIQIPKQLGEVAAFGGSNVEPSIQSCFEKAGNQPDITPAQFVDWMKLEPQSMVWIPVMHRVSAAEASRHQVRCSVCKTSPIIGLRYRCLKCFSFDMCQNCFFAGHTAKSHKLTHPMQEYCGTTTSSENVRDFTKVFKNKFRSKQYFKKHPRLGYLPVQTVMEGGTLERSASEETSLRDASEHFVSSTAASVASTPKQRHGVNDMQRLHSGVKGGSTSMLEMHSRVGTQAKRLHDAERRQKHMAKTVDMEDEHNLIAQYCKNLQGHKTDSLKSPMQIMAGLEADQEAEMEAVIHELETENRALQKEYDQLLLTHRDPTVHPDAAKQLQSNGVAASTADNVEGRDAELLAEAKQLAKHKTQLEVRMRILEDHNRQLEAQLQRLHLLLDQPESNGAHVVTFSSAERHTTPLSTASSHNSLPRRDPPTFASYQQSIRDRTVPNGTYSASEQRLLTEEEELERMMKELQETFPPSEGANNVDNLFQTVGQVSKAVGTLVNIMTVDNDETANQLAESGKQKSHSQK